MGAIENQRETNGHEESGTPRLPDIGGRGTLLWLVMLLVSGAVWFLLPALVNGVRPAEVSYSDFRDQVAAGNVAEVTVQGDRLEGTFFKPWVPAGTSPKGQSAPEQGITNFTTFVPQFGDDQLLRLMEDHGVDVTALPLQDSVWPAIFGLLPFLLLIGLAVFWFRSMRGQMQGVLSIGRSQAKTYEREKAGVTFDDVAGVNGVKTELAEIIEFLKTPQRFQALGGEVPKGVLLVGPPGTGKTLLARAVAGEAGVPFYSITGSDFMEMFVGVGASRVRDLFDKAKKTAPSIIFIDELDSIGRRRGAGLGGGHDEREQTLNQLLSALDGFEPTENVIVMAATNRPDILDPALLRPGRFDRQITVDLPTMAARTEILRIHARNKPLASGVDLERIARGTPGFSGADLRNLLNEAALLAARRDKSEIGLAEIDDARDKVLLGLERENLMLTKEELKLLAYHEAGHAVVAAVLPHADPIDKVTIVPRGRAMGVTHQLPEHDQYVYSSDYMEDRLAVMMGGRAAERLVFDTATSGAENDLKQATELARKMVLDWGMGEELGHIAFGGPHQHVFLGGEIAEGRQYSEATAREVDEEIRRLLDRAFDCAYETLESMRDKLDLLAEILLKEEEVAGARVLEIVGDDARIPDDVPVGFATPNGRDGNSRQHDS